MSCPYCELAASSEEVYWFRWKTANIGIVGCRQHVGEVMQVLCDHIRPAPDPGTAGAGEPITEEKP